ncbi:MAG: S8 family serine peptidase [Bacteroidales bacterium]|nr:S8 family serine peptidase [Bacteroidales bacterium]
MKKFFILIFCLAVAVPMFAQNCYWVFFTDKNNTTFDPYQYFDAKAIERYQLNNLNLYDISNYPVNQDYKDQVNTITEGYVGESRWFNALAVMATENEIEIVKTLPFVAGTQLICTEAVLAQAPEQSTETALTKYDARMNQIALMQGEKFQQKNINGKGVRIAVFDGGFPGVDTHPAFKHLRDNHQIIKTWNFANNKENVYDYNQHGRMVLSCIAGIMNDTTMLGLAPAAEFLLARTEVEAEKKKEEVWWVEALEWADQNGAHIVSSSLGYGIDLHNLKDMDGKTSIVAKGASTAASKGILVCTAMGNEGSDNDWKVLVTPADAENVLSVGAVSSLEKLESYSSFGPTADGRRKPNVVACGHDMVADVKGNYKYYQGTSFATPLVSGFAACVKQMHPDWTVAQLIEEIEKSGNHYPYYDYAFGYGVPQAGYFTESATKTNAHTFDLAEDASNLYVIPLNPYECHNIFFNITNGDGTIEYYDSKEIFIDKDDSTQTIDGNAIQYLRKSSLKEGQIVNIWYNGQYSKYVVGKDKVQQKDYYDKSRSLRTGCDFNSGIFNKAPMDFYKKNRRNIHSSSIVLNASFMVPSMWQRTENIHQTARISRSFSFSWVNNWQVARVYGLGFRLGFGSSWYALQDFQNPTCLYDYPNIGNMDNKDVVDYDIRKHNLKTSQFDLELYQRFILANLSNSKLYLETGAYGDWITGSRLKTKIIYDENHRQTMVDNKYYRDGMYKLNCGVRLRLGFTNWFAIYGQYRITDILKEGNDLPKWEVGIQIF